MQRERGAAARAPGWGSSLAVLLALAAPALPQEGKPPPQPVAREIEQPAQDPVAAPLAPARGAFEAYQPRYHSAEEIEALFEGWLRWGGGEALELRRIDLGLSAGGRQLSALEFGRPGPLPLEQRPLCLLLGAVDGLSLAGAEAVLAVGSELLAAGDKLPQGISVLLWPWVSPDPLAARFTAGKDPREDLLGGRNGRSTDDDGDGRCDEDGPDDLDGDGRVLEMLIADDSAGAFVRAADARFLLLSSAGGSPRFVWTREGRDQDGDGLFNEDGLGGVVLDQNFPIDWPGPTSGAACGPLPVSEPESRALAGLVLKRKCALALVFQGSHGHLATPGALPLEHASLSLPFAQDRGAFERLNSMFVKRTARALGPLLTLAEARASSVARQTRSGGALIDWLYAASGVLAVEVAPWGPDVEFGSTENGASTQPARAERGPAVVDQSPVERAWTRWLDDRRGGLGFVDWHPVGLGSEAGGEHKALVGGWEPFTRDDPPPASLERALAGLGAFTLDSLQSLPRLELELTEAVRDGDLARVRVRVRNAGQLPTGMALGQSLLVRLALPAGSRLAAGAETQVLAHLAAGATSAELAWLVVCPEGTPLLISAEDQWTQRAEREVRP